MNDILRRSVNLFDFGHRWSHSENLSVLPPLDDNITETNRISIEDGSQSPFIDYSRQVWGYLDSGTDLNRPVN